MSLRSTLKVAKYGLFYFEMAKSTSIVQTKNIKKVITRDNMSNGSRFLLQYGKEVLEATIIGVAGKILLFIFLETRPCPFSLVLVLIFLIYFRWSNQADPDGYWLCDQHLLTGSDESNKESQPPPTAGPQKEKEPNGEAAPKKQKKKEEASVITRHSAPSRKTLQDLSIPLSCKYHDSDFLRPCSRVTFCLWSCCRVNFVKFVFGSW